MHLQALWFLGLRRQPKVSCEWRKNLLDRKVCEKLNKVEIECAGSGFSGFGEIIQSEKNFSLFLSAMQLLSEHCVFVFCCYLNFFLFFIVVGSN